MRRTMRGMVAASGMLVAPIAWPCLSVRSFCSDIAAAAVTADALLSTDKVTLRKEIRRRVRELSPDELKTQSTALAARVAMTPEFSIAPSVGIFLSMPKGELDTVSLLEAAFAKGKAVYVPRVSADLTLCEMELVLVR